MIVLFLLLACSTPGRSQASNTSVSEVRAKLLAAKSALMAADYAADLALLAKTRSELQSLRAGGDTAQDCLLNYWSGFASWRLAINGVSRQMARSDVRDNLLAALGALEKSAALCPDSADALSAASSVDSWLGTFEEDPQAARERYQRASTRLKKALQLDPQNPRVLWVEGGSYLFRPRAYGGDPARALEIYATQARVAPAEDPGSPLPDWGKPEAWMSLAYAHFNADEPDLAAAEKEARTAIELEPEWFYVRTVLLPQITAAISRKPEN